MTTTTQRSTASSRARGERQASRILIPDTTDPVRVSQILATAPPVGWRVESAGREPLDRLADYFILDSYSLATARVEKAAQP